jgi:hypothetical protein
MPLDPYYEALAPLIGHIVIEHGNLEGAAGRMLARLNGKGDEHSAGVYAAKKSFNEKIAEIRKLVQTNVKEQDLIDEFAAILVEMERVNRARNLYIHSEYMAEVDADNNYLLTRHRQIKQMGDLIDLNDPDSMLAIHVADPATLEKLVEDMISLEHDIRVLSEKYFDAQPYVPIPNNG